MSTIVADPIESAPTGGLSPKPQFQISMGKLLVALALTILNLWASTTFAEEPAKRFLSRLREEGYFDQGLKYLEISAAKNRLPESMKADLPLERVILMQDSLKSVKTQQQRDERIAAIEKGYRDFLSQSPTHSRRSETQTKLGDLLLDRGQSALDESKKPENVVSSESWRSKSRQAYTEALDLYKKIYEELKPILESMEGDKIKTIKIEGKGLKELTELRDQYRREYRQAQILEAKTMDFLAQTYDEPSPDRRKWLEKSETSFNAIVEKTTGAQEAGRRFLSLIYLGAVQVQLGKFDEARNSYNRVADNEESGIFRTWRVQAIAEIIRIDSSDKAAKYEAAIQRGDEALKASAPKERDDPEWLDMQLALADARLAWGKTIDPKKEENKFRNNRKAARELLQTILKKKGPHLVKAKKSLSELGIETEEKVDDKLPATKAWADTIKVARDRLDRAESAESTLSVLQQQLAAVADNEKPPIQAQIQTIQENTLRDRKQAIELYQRALRLFRDSDSRDELLEAKFLLAYLHLKTEQYWETVAHSQELLVSAKGTDKAQKAGGFALIGLGKILSEATSERQLGFFRPLENLATQLNVMDSASDEAKNAVELLVKLDLIHKRNDDALKHIAIGKGNGGGSSASLVGQILWGEYQQAASERRKDKTEETPDDKDKKQKAENLLRSTWDALAADKADKNMVNGVNTLANIYLMSDRIDEALLILESPTKGAIALADSVVDLDTNTKLEAYRLKLQAIVQAAGSGKSLTNAGIAEVVQKMKAFCAGDDSLLTNSLNNLAVKLVSKLEANKNAEEKAKLALAFGVVIQQLVEVSSDVAILDSAGSSIFTIATQMLKDPTQEANGKSLMVTAESAFSKVASKPIEELVAAKRKPEDFQLRLALAKSGAGKFEEAHALFLKSLTANPSILMIQVEAARNLQSWSLGKDAELLKKAVLGAEPNAKRANTIWGWNKISGVTASRVADFKDVFFEARLNIAKDLRLIALTEPTPEKKKQGLERALSKIRETYQTHPELGSNEIRANFEKILRELQQELGKPVSGLLEFKS
jgi:hypothetical protein